MNGTMEIEVMRGRVTAPASEFDYLGAESMNDRTCSIDGCPEKHVARGLCRSHYNAMKYAGVLMPPTTKRHAWDDSELAGVLSASGMELVERKAKRVRVRCQVCGSESTLWLTHVVRGSSGCRPCRLVAKREASRTYGKWKGDDIEYGAVHKRLDVLRGKAAALACIDCGEQADDWSYAGGSDKERISTAKQTAGMVYTTDLDAYVPRCKRDHKRHDLEVRRAS